MSTCQVDIVYSAKEIFGLNLLLGEKTVRPTEGGTPNSFGKMGGTHWNARSASRIWASKKPLSLLLVLSPGIEPRMAH